jgi:hypothetical protein
MSGMEARGFGQFVRSWPIDANLGHAAKCHYRPGADSEMASHPGRSMPSGRPAIVVGLYNAGHISSNLPDWNTSRQGGNPPAVAVTKNRMGFSEVRFATGISVSVILGGRDF